jgi:hypothetical protein
MKKLFTKQEESKLTLLRELSAGGGALDSSHTGVGKTVIASHLARDHGLPVAVICPKIVVPQWERELAEAGVVPVFVTNYEKIKRGNKFIAKVGKKMFRWQLPEKTLIIWDEVHKCAGAFSQNAQMLIAAKQGGHSNLMLSATACQDPTEMRAIGYVLGCHSLNKAEGSLPSWFSWMKGFGCRQDQWRNWVRGPAWMLEPLNQKLYSTNCVKLTPKDLPGEFADNHIITEPLAFTALKDIEAFYRNNGVTPEIVEQMINGDVKPSPYVLVEILRARQLAEAAKVPDIVSMTMDAVCEGMSVVVFVNFKDTLKALEAALPGCGVIHGGQSADEREAAITHFQADRTHVMVANGAAGGVGVSLHDVRGERPRLSLISPSFNLKEYIQTLGRIHRAGAKSPACQRILVASKTIEEKVLQVLEGKRKSLDTLHAQPTQP